MPSLLHAGDGEDPRDCGIQDWPEELIAQRVRVDMDGCGMHGYLT
jgi:hypothetical protein